MSRLCSAETDIRAAINTVIDPCSRAAGTPAGLIDMGLIRDLNIVSTEHGVDVRVVVAVTEYGCLLGPAFANEIEQVVTGMAGVQKVTVDLDNTFDWEPEDMSPAYQERLAARRTQGRPFFLPLSLADPAAEQPQ